MSLLSYGDLYDINVLKKVTLSSGEAIGLFAQKSGMKLFANQGDIEVQAQNANLNMAAKQDDPRQNIRQSPPLSFFILVILLFILFR
ncbi:DUF2345 domain-containing protein [Gilliamella sp. Pas-s27]|uniref:DUF2345 domain-containing protein n=1 Tax=Gilliamella sp. Pas-s27 TaxID=2687311 RepID=UPI001365C71D|nr:DUF2345 domain-containing protein [Gilliamella sp. Pas-s27]